MEKNARLRLLTLKNILETQTDDDHWLTGPQMLEHLAAQGFTPDRKSLYDDLDALRKAGLDLHQQRGRKNGYWVGQRTFELPELKLLVDAVQSSRFITKRKSARLIAKLESLTSVHQAWQLQRQVEVGGRIKTANESIYYVVDTIHTAILQKCKLQFRYKNWVVDPRAPGGFTSRDRHAGRVYTVSPWALAWVEENYYLIAFDDDSGAIRHYRVDKMHAQKLLDAPRAGEEAFGDFALSRYTQSRFGMFSGTPVDVCLQMENDLVGVLIDRFGRELTLHPTPDGRFTVWLQLVPGPTFYGWVLSFGARAQVLEPAFVRNEVAACAMRAAAQYLTPDAAQRAPEDTARSETEDTPD